MSTDVAALIAAMRIDPREAQLPKWVQAKLTSLRRQLQDQQHFAREARLATNPATSLHLIHVFREIPVGLGDEQVCFRPTVDMDPLEAFRVRADPTVNGIKIISGTTPLYVIPSASNVVYITAGQLP